MDPFDPVAIRAAYDTAAADYVTAFADDLGGLPVDRSLLDGCAQQLNRGSRVLDLGCGPGQVADYLTRRGLQVIGLDLSHQMLTLGSGRTHGVTFAGGDMRWLPFRSQSFRAVVAYYSVQHLPRSELPLALKEIHRVLTSDGRLVLATHLGEGETQIDEFLGHAVSPFGGTFYAPDELEDEFRRQLFSVEQSQQRDPLPHEHQSKRIYLVARREDPST
jgi:ubiquinone/menaquinone biosynthesis C-methylase UbiE